MAMDDAFIHPELDLQMHQSNIDDGADYVAVLLQRSIHNADTSVEDMISDTQSATALEAMADFIKDKKVDKTSAILFNIATEGYGNLSTLKDSRTAFAMESMDKGDDYMSDEDKQVAMENLTYNTLYVMDKLSQSMRNSMLAMGDLVHSFDRNLAQIKRRVSALETLLAEIDNRHELAYNYVKPEKQFIHLMYTKEGFGLGIKPVLEDVQWLFKEHADMVGDSIKQYKQWYIHHKNNMDDVAVFDDLSYRPEDFILSGSTIFNKSVGTKKPGKAAVFYRTKELPGGLSFYTEVHNSSEKRLGAIDALMDVNYFLDYYEPDSFRVTEKRVYTVAALGLLTWASVMVANPLPMAFAGVLVGAVNDTTKTSDIKKIRISEDTVFPVLGKDGLKQTVVKLKELIHGLESWNEIVYEHNWRDKAVKEMLNDLSEHIKKEGYNRGNVRHFRNYSIAMVSLMSKSYTKLHSYGFEVINAALSYAEKSARQYR